jgi:putative ABC transport system substrate-binding protein
MGPLIAEAQRPAGVSRIGFLTVARLSSNTSRTEAFRQGLRNLGYVEGQNIVVEWRSADETLNRLPALAAELVDLKVALIVTADNASTVAAKEVTKTVPIVMATSADPVGIGLVASLARPAGNVTGLTAARGRGNPVMDRRVRSTWKAARGAFAALRPGVSSQWQS